MDKPSKMVNIKLPVLIGIIAAMLIISSSIVILSPPKTITQTITQTITTQQTITQTIQQTITQITTKPITIQETVTKPITIQETITKPITIQETSIVTIKEPLYPLTVVDGYGRAVTIEKEPFRIVSLAPSVTEILFAIKAGDKVIGVDKFSDYPKEVTDKVKEGKIAVVGGIVDPVLEKIIELKPDLIIMGLELQKKLVSSFEDKGLKVLGFGPSDLPELYQKILTIGKVVNREKEAFELVNKMKSKVDEIVNKVKTSKSRPKVYYEVWPNPLISVAKGTWIHDLITLAGGINIFANATAPYPRISSEAVIQANPDIIILPYEIKIEDVKSRPGWDKINAVKNNKIYQIDSNLVNRSGPRIVEGLELLAKIIHPELFY
ncbi:Vitamin B12-binding protein [archaeon HR06]|nr:Vitamin B12-binding protein [archaeon HR06]